MQQTQSLREALRRPPTEFEVQSDCYQYLKNEYPIVRGEIKVQFERIDKKSRRPRGARFDLVVCDRDYEPQFVVEVKRHEGRMNTKSAHYERLSGVRCYTVGSLAQCQDLVSRLKNK